MLGPAHRLCGRLPRASVKEHVAVARLHQEFVRKIALTTTAKWRALLKQCRAKAVRIPGAGKLARGGRARRGTCVRDSRPVRVMEGAEAVPGYAVPAKGALVPVHLRIARVLWSHVRLPRVVDVLEQVGVVGRELLKMLVRRARMVWILLGVRLRSKLVLHLEVVVLALALVRLRLASPRQLAAVRGCVQRLRDFSLMSQPQ